MLERQKKVLMHMLASYDIAPGKTHVGVTQVGPLPTIPIKLSDVNDLSMLKTAIADLRVDDAGNLIDALRVANDRMFSRAYGGRPGFNRSLVVFVNENVDEGVKALKDIGKQLKDNSVNVVVVELSEGVTSDKVRAISTPNQVFFISPLLDELDTALYPVIRSTYPGTMYLA